MPELNQTTNVEILGEEYKIKSDISPEEMQNLAQYVNTKIGEIRNKAANIPLLRIAVLACLNISEELFAVKKQLDETQNLMEDETIKILKMLDESFRLSAYK